MRCLPALRYMSPGARRERACTGGGGRLRSSAAWALARPRRSQHHVAAAMIGRIPRCCGLEKAQRNGTGVLSNCV